MVCSRPLPKTAHHRRKWLLKPFFLIDRLAICTDGVWSPLGAEKLGDLLGAEGENAPWIAESIARAAVEAAGTHADNATVLVLIAQPDGDEAQPSVSQDPADAVADIPSTPTTPSFPRLMLDMDPL